MVRDIRVSVNIHNSPHISITERQQCLEKHTDMLKCEKTYGVATISWLRLVRSFELYVTFAEYSLFYRALLQMRPTILRSLLIVATS